MSVCDAALVAARPSIVRMNTPASPQRLHRSYGVMCGPYSLGALRQCTPVRMTNTLSICRWSIVGVQWLLGKIGRNRSIYASVSQSRSLIPVFLMSLNQVATLTSIGPDPAAVFRPRAASKSKSSRCPDGALGNKFLATLSGSHGMSSGLRVWRRFCQKLDRF